MKKNLLCLCFLMLIAINLSGTPYEQTEEYEKNQAILNERAAKFRAETGFVGEIGYSHQPLGFNNYRGNFQDIPITAPQDSNAMKNVFEQIFSKLEPYIKARKAQFVREDIVNLNSSIYITYRQRVNGYEIEGAGELKIIYNTSTNEIIIRDNTVCILDDFVLPVFTKEDAVDIYRSTVPDDEVLIMFPNRNPKFRLSYCNIYEYQFEKRPEYRLCWVGGSSRKLLIDSISGELYLNALAVIYNVNDIAILASYDAEYERKTQELKQLAERFKVETGFVGDITYNYRDMKFSYLRGTFKNLEVTAPQDTMLIKEVFNRLVSSIVPYLSAREEDLLMGSIVANDLRTSVRYTQRVNGYSIEPAAWLNISFVNALKLFTVTDNTVSIGTNLVVPTVSEDKAKQIYQELISRDEKNHVLAIPPRIRLAYFNINRYQLGLAQDYRLCWILGGVRTIVLDAVSEEVYINKSPSIIHD